MSPAGSMTEPVSSDVSDCSIVGTSMSASAVSDAVSEVAAKSPERAASDERGRSPEHDAATRANSAATSRHLIVCVRIMIRSGLFVLASVKPLPLGSRGEPTRGFGCVANAPKRLAVVRCRLLTAAGLPPMASRSLRRQEIWLCTDRLSLWSPFPHFLLVAGCDTVPKQSVLDALIPRTSGAAESTELATRRRSAASVENEPIIRGDAKVVHVSVFAGLVAISAPVPRQCAAAGSRRWAQRGVSCCGGLLS